MHLTVTTAAYRSLLEPLLRTLPSPAEPGRPASALAAIATGAGQATEPANTSQSQPSAASGGIILKPHLLRSLATALMDLSNSPPGSRGPTAPGAQAAGTTRAVNLPGTAASPLTAIVVTSGIPTALLQGPASQALVLGTTLLGASSRQTLPPGTLPPGTATGQPPVVLATSPTSGAAARPDMAQTNRPLATGLSASAEPGAVAESSGTGTRAPAAPAAGPARYLSQLTWQGRSIEVQTERPLVPGSRVATAPAGAGMLTLTPLSLPPGSATRGLAQSAMPVSEARGAALQQAVREALPRQQPLADLLSRLQHLLSQPAVRLAPAVRVALQQLTTLPHPQQLGEPSQLKQALLNSGSFTEGRLQQLAQRLAQHGSGTPAEVAGSVARTVADDRKAQIGRLLALLAPMVGKRTAIQETPAHVSGDMPRLPEQLAHAESAAPPLDVADRESANLLNRLLQAALARVQVHQLESAASRQPSGAEASPPAPAWAAELPLQTALGAEAVQVRIERRDAASRSAAGGRVWQIQLDFDLHDLGRFSATLRLQGNDVAATLWSEKAATHQLVRDAVDELRERLANAGVAVTEMHCLLGLPAAPPSRHRQLVDVRT